MKICIDISQVVFKGSGVENYTRNLVREVLRENKKTNSHQYILFGTSLRQKVLLDDFAFELRKEGLIFKTSFWALPPSFTSTVWNQVHHVKIERLTGKIDVFHSSDWTQPPTRAKKVTTIHDLVTYKFPEASNKTIVDNMRHKNVWVKKEVDAIIAVSKNTKQDIIDILEIPQNKIHVIYEGVGEDFLNFKPGKDKTSKKYILAMSGVGNRKNTDRVEEAFNLLKPKGVELSIVGKNLGFVKQSDLPSLYANSQVFVYPSLYEGFGLPVLEAMSVGCPVITSNNSSLPEVGGDAAIYVDPRSVEDIKDKITEVLSLSPKSRKSLVEKGFAQSKKFSWNKAAKETIKLYESL